MSVRPTAYSLAVLVAGIVFGYAVGHTPPPPTVPVQEVRRLTFAEHRALSISCASERVAAEMWRTTSEPLLWERQAARDIGYEYARLAALTCGLAGVSR